MQYPCSFEFSLGYLVKLFHHSQSCLFGTFFCNTVKERIENSVYERTFSVWSLLDCPLLRNPLYSPSNEQTVLWPSYYLKDLLLWKDVYQDNSHPHIEMLSSTTNCKLHGALVKTKSFNNLRDFSDDEPSAKTELTKSSSDPTFTQLLVEEETNGDYKNGDGNGDDDEHEPPGQSQSTDTLVPEQASTAKDVS